MGVATRHSVRPARGAAHREKTAWVKWKRYFPGDEIDRPVMGQTTRMRRRIDSPVPPLRPLGHVSSFFSFLYPNRARFVEPKVAPLYGILCSSATGSWARRLDVRP